MVICRSIQRPLEKNAIRRASQCGIGKIPTFENFRRPGSAQIIDSKGLIQQLNWFGRSARLQDSREHAASHSIFLEPFEQGET